MSAFPILLTITHSLHTLLSVTCGLVRMFVLLSHSRRALAAENLFLRKQLALFQEGKVKPRRTDDSARSSACRARWASGSPTSSEDIGRS